MSFFYDTQLHCFFFCAGFKNEIPFSIKFFNVFIEKHAGLQWRGVDYGSGGQW